MKPSPAPNVPGDTEAERMSNAVRKMFSVPKEAILKAEAKWQNVRPKKKRTMHAKSFLVLLAFSGFCWPAKADYRVKQYREIIAAKDPAAILVLQSYLYGFGRGLSFANVTMELKTGKRLYCQPPALSLKPENYIDIINRQIKEDSTKLTEADLGEEWIELLLLTGLETTFPCSPK